LSVVVSSWLAVSHECPMSE